MKKLLSMFISLTLVLSSFGTASVSAATDPDGHYDHAYGKVDTRRVYFYMPSDWYNEFSKQTGDTAGMYWWGGTGSGNPWCGYKAYADAQPQMYYVDLPSDVPMVIWNNYVNGEMDTEAPIYKGALQTIDIPSEGYTEDDDSIYLEQEGFWEEMGDSFFYGDKSALGDFVNTFEDNEDYGFMLNFDNMVYVLDDNTKYSSESALSGKLGYSGEWFFYFGDGTYGSWPTAERSKEEMAKGNGIFGELKYTHTPMNEDGFKEVDGEKYYYYLTGDSDNPYGQRARNGFFSKDGKVYYAQKNGNLLRNCKTYFKEEDAFDIFGNKIEGFDTDREYSFDGNGVLQTIPDPPYPPYPPTPDEAGEQDEPTEPATIIDEFSYVQRDDSGSKVYFDVNTTNWNAEKIKQGVFFYLYDYWYGELITWGSKKGKMTDEGDGIYSFDFANKGIELTGDHGYFCIFAAGTTWSLQTSDLLISPECFGHTASCTGKLVENNVDSEKKSYYVVWDNGVDRSKYAPPLTITSLGNIVGEALRPSATKLDILCDFLLYTLDNAREYSGKSDQQLLDDIADQLGISKDEVEKAILCTGVYVDWGIDGPVSSRVYPGLYSARSVYDGVRIEWEQLENVYGYRVFCYGKDGWHGIADTTSTSYLDTNVRNGRTYIYTVRAINKDGDYVSNYDRFGIDCTYYKTPEINKYQCTEDGIKLSWDKIDGVYSYRVFYNGKDGWVELGNTTSNSFVDDEVKSGSTYTYTIIGMNASGYFITDYNPDGFKATFIATPKVNKIENTANGVKLSWNSVDGAAKYRVYYKGKNGDWKGMGNTTSTSFVDTDVRSGGTYTYTVRCLDKDGNCVSDYNHTGWKHTFVATPNITSFTNTKSGVKISWNKVPGAAKYRVFYKNSKGGWTGMGNTTSTSFVDTDVRSGGTYTYTVRCLDKDGNFISDYNHTGSKHTFVATPMISSLTSTKSGVKIGWNKVTGAAKYRVYYKGRNGWTRLGDTTGTSFVDTDVRSGGTYTYTVRCISADGKEFTSYYDTAGKTITYKR